METMFSTPLLCLTLAALAGCSAMQQKKVQANEDTKAIGFLIQSVGTSAAAFQEQRDKIAVASRAQRNGLEALAIRYETTVANDAAAWNVAHQVERKRTFDTVRLEADKQLALREQQQQHDREHAAELAKTRSAVNFRTAKIAEAAAGLISLAEHPSRKAEAQFLFQFAKNVRADIVNDSEAAAAKLADKASATYQGEQ